MGALCAALAGAGCGGSDTTTGATTGTAPAGAAAARAAQEAAARKTCAVARDAAARGLGGPVRLRITGPDPAYIDCVLRGEDARIEVIAQGVPQARNHYETDVAHQVQVYAEPGGKRNRAQLPRDVAGVGGKASWIPAQRELLATNGTTHRGGSFVTVEIRGHAADRARDRALARAVARAALETAPRGPKPAPPAG